MSILYKIYKELMIILNKMFKKKFLKKEMKQGYVYEDPHKELTIQQKGGCTEAIIKAILIKSEHHPKKLCQYNKINNRLELLEKNVDWVIKNSKIKENKKEDLKKFLKNNMLGLPDFIVLKEDKEIMFVEVKYNKSWFKDNQRKRQRDLKNRGYEVRLERTGKFEEVPNQEWEKLKRKIFLRKFLFWRKSKLITTHKI